MGADTIPAVALVSFGITGLLVSARIVVGAERTKPVLTWTAIVFGIVGTVAGIAAFVQ